ncbi:MAG: sulfurtransferase [Gallicola sp.]|uniref:sulfurtransferase n=1 Tax=Gallicola sp. Sow4_E12 TaxID=3438785 RepID=UPI00182A342A|nr:sulfurtransferase [Gallicola sp.]
MKKVWWKVFLSCLAVVLLASCSGENTQEKVASNETQQQEGAFTGIYIVQPSYVKEHISDENMILVDARGEETARKGTINGAVATNWQYLSNVEDAPKGDYAWGLILPAEELGKRLGEVGLSKDKEIVLFADGAKGWGDDGRILWTLRAAGYNKLKMVDGGFKGLQNAGLETTREPKKLEPVEVSIEEVKKDHVIDTEELEKTIDDYKVVDVRADEEYEGAILYGEAKGGRIPGAIHLKFTDLFNDKGYLKTNEELTAFFEAAGLQKTDKIVTYCTSGIRSAYAQLVMEMLGFETSKNYDGSYNTWCVHNPVEK